MGLPRHAVIGLCPGNDLRAGAEGNPGQVVFDTASMPCTIAGLGPGKVDYFLRVDPPSAKFIDARNVVPQSGHVYLLNNQGSGNHRVLFQLEFDEKVSRVPGRP
jgi:hypothetical protein